MIGITILDMFEKVWDQKIEELSNQRKQIEEWKRKKENIQCLPLIDFSILNLLTIKLVQINNNYSDVEIYKIFENMPNKKISVEQHRQYFEYALINARYIEQDLKVVIAKDVKKSTSE